MPALWRRWRPTTEHDSLALRKIAMCDAVADPNTPESVVLAQGLDSAELIDAALTRPIKSADLIWIIISAVSAANDLTSERAERILVELTSEPELRSTHVQFMTRASRWYTTTILVAVLAGHRLPDVAAWASALTATSRDTAAGQAQATGTLLPAATWWALNADPARAAADPPKWHHEAASRTDALAALWTEWAGDDPARLAFLLTNWTRFTDTAQMLAVGDALLAQRQPTQCA